MLSRFFIARPVFATVISVLITLLGAVAYFRLPVEQYPDLAPPIVRVAALYPGANAKTIAETVAATLEQEINGVERMIYMNSTSSDGRYELDISFEQGADIDLAAVLVQNRVSVAESRLPEEVRRLGITTKKQSTALIGVISIWSDDGRYDDLYLSNYITLNMKDEISRVPGVGGTAIFPAKEYGMRVWLDPEKLKARELTVADVNAAIAGQNVQVAAGAIGRPPAPVGQDFEFIVSTKGRLTDPAEFGEIIIKSDDRRVVRVRDVARVELGARDYSTIAAFNGKPAGIIPVYQLPGANLVAVAEAVEKKLEELKADFPDGLQGKYFYDSSMFIRASLHEVNKTLLEAFVLVFLVVLLFLQSLRATLIPALTIPVSLIGTFALMAAFGFSVNMLTMFGLVLAIGIVVDDAIVVVENVERNMMLHKLGAREATIRAMGEITGPIIAITLVLMSVFIPAAALPGITGQMYRQFALTIAASTALSAVCALTLSPALCALLLKSHEGHAKPAWWTLPQRTLARWFNQFFDGLTALYAGFARLGAAAAPLSLAAFGLVLWWTFTGLSRLPTGFVPNEDLGFVMVAAQLPDGSSLERADAVLKRVSEECRKVEGVKDVTGLTGFSVLDGQGSVYANAWIVLDDWEERTKHKRDVDTIMNDIRGRVGPMQEAQFLVFGLPAISGLGNTSGFDIRIQDKQGLGRELQQQMVEELCGKAMTQSKIMFAFSGFRSGVPQLYLDIDREKAIKLGVSLPTVFQTLQTHLGSAYVNDFNLRGRTFQVSTQADHAFRVKPQDILRLEVRNERGQMVPIGTFTAVSDTLGPDRVTRYNMYTSAAINGIPAPGASSGEAMQVMEEIAKQSLPKGMGFEWTGLSYQERKAGSQGLLVFGLGLVLVYLILAAQYESWTTPLSVALSVPLVIIGAVLALQYRNFDNNVFTQIGLVLLVGLGAKNAILIVEFARENVARGMTPLDAAVDAAKTRFRPIIMTSLAFILGVTPLLTASGAGAASRQALGTAVFGGMIGQTVLGLFFTPMLFVVVENVVGLFRKSKPAVAAHTPAPPAPPSTPSGALPTPA